MSDNIKEFKKGDEVVVCIDNMGGISIGVDFIKNITPKGTISTLEGGSFYSDGHYRSTERYNTKRGYILPYDENGKQIVEGANCIYKIKNNTIRSLYASINKIYSQIYKNKQCDTEKLESIKNRLDEITKELCDMVEDD